MFLSPATEADFPAIIDLANIAYRGVGTTKSWNHETGILEGQRLNDSLLREDLAASPNGHLLLYRDDPSGPLLGTVWLNPQDDGVWYLGLFTIRPELQNRHLGRKLLAAAEDFAKHGGACRIPMTV